MKCILPLAMSGLLAAPVCAQEGLSAITASSVSESDVAAVSPALARYAAEDVEARLWARPELPTRDRALVTLAIMIARNQTVDQQHYTTIALDNGISPAEISEVVTHLAFYAGWSNAMAAIPPIKSAFDAHGVEADQLPAAEPDLLTQDAEAEASRVARVSEMLGDASPGLEEFTTDPLFSNLWLRPDLAPRDRSLVTVAALIANGQSAQLGGHLSRAMANGLTAEQAGEVVVHAAFYSGWPTAFSAGPVVKDTLAAQQE